MPSLEQLYQKMKGSSFELIGIDIQEKRDDVVRYIRKNGLTFPNLLDQDGQVAAIYGVRSTPMKFLIDAQGNLVAAAMGYREWDREEVIAIIDLLKNGRG